MNFDCEIFCRGEGRPDMRREGKDLLLSLKHIFFSHIFARTYVAKAHNSGLFRFDINPISNAYLDWCAAAFKHVSCLMNIRVWTNFGRIKVCEFLIAVAVSISFHEK